MSQVQVYNQDSVEVPAKDTNIFDDICWADLQEILQAESCKDSIQTYSSMANADNSEYYKIYKDIEESCKKFEAKMKKKRVRRSFTPYQLYHLENFFQQNIYPTTDHKRVLSITLDISEARVRTWFHNRRQKYKKVLTQEPHVNAEVDDILHIIQGQTTQDCVYNGDKQNNEDRCSVVNQHNYFTGDNPNCMYGNCNMTPWALQWNYSPSRCSSVQSSSSSRSSESPKIYNYYSPPNNINT